MGVAGDGGQGGKRKSFRTVGFCRYTGLNGLATSGWQPTRVQIPAHTRAHEYGGPGHTYTYIHTGRKLLPCLTINGACPEPREFRSLSLHLRTACPAQPFQPTLFPPLCTTQTCLSARYALRVKSAIFLFYYKPTRSTGVGE